MMEVVPIALTSFGEYKQSEPVIYFMKHTAVNRHKISMFQCNIKYLFSGKLQSKLLFQVQIQKYL